MPRVIFLILCFVCFAPLSLASGPGVSTQKFSQAELFNILGRIDSSNGARSGHSSAFMYRGYLVLVEAKDSGGLGNSAISFWDISDIRAPKLIASHNNKNNPQVAKLTEGHTFAVVKYDERELVVLRETRGISFWDLRNPYSIKRVSSLELAPLLGGDYSNTVWWFAAVGKYIYATSTNHGTYVIDALDYQRPKLVKRIPIDNTGGFLIGPVFGLGNMLIASTFDANGLVSFDISEPSRPVVKDVITDENADVGYAINFNGGFVYGGHVYPKVWDARDLSSIKLLAVNSELKMGPKGAYSKFQDGHILQGVSHNVAWIDYRNKSEPKVLNSISRDYPSADLDSGNIVGHIGIGSCDHGSGSILFPLRTEPDNTAPKINFSSPQNGATRVSPSAAIGISFTDQIAASSVNGENLYLLDSNKVKIPLVYSTQNSLVSVSPKENLSQQKSYRLIAKTGGIRDYAGNALEKEYQLEFSTGEGINHSNVVIDSTIDGRSVSLSIKNMPSSVKKIHWSFGDGKSKKYRSGKKIKHRYKSADNYLLKAEYQLNSENYSVYRNIVVGDKVNELRGVSASSMVLDSALKRLWVSNPDNNSVTALDSESMNKIFEIAVGERPRNIALNNEQHLVWLVEQKNDRLLAIDARTGKAKKHVVLPYGYMPYGLLFIDDRYAVVSSENLSEFAVVDTHKAKLVKRNLINGADGGLRGIAYNKFEKQLYFSQFISTGESGKVFQIDLNKDFSIKRSHTIELDLDKGPDKEDGGRGLANYLSTLTISPNGKQLLVPSKKDNIQRGLFRDKQALSFDNSVRAMLARINLNREASEQINLRHDFDDRALPHMSIFSKDGRYIMVSLLASNTVEIINAFDNSRVATLNTGAAPESLLLSDDGKHLYVHSFLDRVVEKYSLDELLSGKSRSVPLLSKASLVDQEILPAIVLQGKKIFYQASDARMSLNGYLSCAVCHLDGRHDGQVWDFTDRGEGLRNTSSLINGDSGFLHWTANFNEVQDFENDIRGPFSGLGFSYQSNRLSNTQFKVFHSTIIGKQVAGLSHELDSLAAYVAHLNSEKTRSPYRIDGKLMEQAQVGKLLFSKLGCDTCHGGKNFGAGRAGYLVDVGTLSEASGQRMARKLTGLDVPTLRGLWRGGPYLHDGSAKTLADIWRVSSDDHGDVKNLTEQQQSQLFSYLKQIDSRENSVKAQDIKASSYGQVKKTLHLPKARQELAKQIVRSTERKIKQTPYSQTTAFAVDTAYDVQRRYARLREKSLGKQTGVKVAFASLASQKAWGLSESVSAPLFKKQQVENDGTIKRSDFLHFHIEAEIAFVIKKTLNSLKQLPRSQQARVMKSLVSSVNLSLDIPDNRFTAKPTAVDLIASGAGAQNYMLGPDTQPDNIDFNELDLELFRNEKLVYKGPANAVMGNPWKVLHWYLKRELMAGRSVEKGTVVLTGAVAKAYGASTNDVLGSYVARAKGMGEIRVEVSE